MSAITNDDLAEAERRVRQRLVDAELATVVLERAAREAEAEQQRIIAARDLAEKQAQAQAQAKALAEKLQEIEAQVPALMDELTELCQRFAAVQDTHRQTLNQAHAVLQDAYGREAMTITGQMTDGHILRLPGVDPADKVRNAARQALVFLIEHR